LSNNFKEKEEVKVKKEEPIEKKEKVTKAKKEKKVKFVSSTPKIKLTDIEKKVLKKLKKYNFKKTELHPRLFDLT
jgi:hypothetical protein